VLSITNSVAISVGPIRFTNILGVTMIYP